MTYEEIGRMVGEIADAIGCPYAYYSREEADVVKAPYLLFDYPQRNDFCADDRNYTHIQRVSIEYDSRSKEIDTERKIEAILDKYDLAYTREDNRETSQQVYEVMYSMEVTVDG